MGRHPLVARAAARRAAWLAPAWSAPRLTEATADIYANRPAAARRAIADAVRRAPRDWHTRLAAYELASGTPGVDPDGALRRRERRAVLRLAPARSAQLGGAGAAPDDPGGTDPGLGPAPE
jgi:hypothetical protein